MNMKINYIFVQILAVFWLMTLPLFMGGCSDNYYSSDEGLGNGETVALKLDLTIPDESMAITRSMTTDQEQAINNFQVLVFKVEGAEEVFSYKAPFTKSSAHELVVEAKVSPNNESYRFVILANADNSIIPVEGASKEAVLDKYLFANQGKWGSQAIPMWGEYNETFVVTRERYISILLHRAMARVDVGLCFKEQTQDNQTEEVDGLDNFKINSVRVYRTKNKAYAATSDTRMTAGEITTPHVPGTAKYNSNDGGNSGYDSLEEADQDPLVYEVDDLANPSGVDRYVREIYIPESIESVDGKTMDEVPCLVIGGFYNGSKTETFYRVDFATYTNGKVEKYKPILRNNRYVFNVKSVNNSGFKEPDQALKSIAASMILDVQVWNDRPLNCYVQGDYFFHIANRHVVLEAMPGEDPEGIFTDANFCLLRVPFSTNLTLSQKNIKYRWESEANGIFKTPGAVQEESESFFTCANNTGLGGEENALTGAFINVDKSRMLFGTSPNVGEPGAPAVERSDILHLQIENFEFSILVTQKETNIEYDLQCETIQVHGKYREGVPLNYTHFITLQIKATLPITKGEEIIIHSETRKGISFIYREKAERDIAVGEVISVKLQGQGTPTRNPNDGNMSDPANPKDGVMLPIENLIINSNSTSGSSCNNARIFFGYQTKRILTIGANAVYRFGYVLEPNTAPRAFVDASINFGTDPNSAVTMEQFPDDYPVGDLDGIRSPTPGGQVLDFNSAKNNAFHVEFMSTTNGRMRGEWIRTDVLKDLLENFKPHIILTGQAICYEAADIALIVDFVNKGGVFLMFNEYYPSVANTNNMVQALLTTKGTGSNKTESYNNIHYKLLDSYPKDPILEGPFYEGSLAGKEWGSDGICLHGFTGLSKDEVQVYSFRHDDAALFFRHKTKPFVFIGDGGFLSNPQRFIGDSYQGSYVYCPFAINSAYQPIPRINYTNARNLPVYNSQLFGNILTWAVDWAESAKGIKY